MFRIMNKIIIITLFIFTLVYPVFVLNVRLAKATGPGQCRNANSCEQCTQFEKCTLINTRIWQCNKITGECGYASVSTSQCCKMTESEGVTSFCTACQNQSQSQELPPEYY